eukprot:gene43585-56934_t
MAFIGVGGDGVSHMLWRAREGAAAAAGDGVRLVVVFAGTNNRMKGHGAAQIADGALQQGGFPPKKEKEEGLPKSHVLCAVSQEANGP